MRRLQFVLRSGWKDEGYFFFSSRRRHTRFKCDWSSDVCSSDLDAQPVQPGLGGRVGGVPPHAVEQQRQRHIVRRGELWHELPELEHEAERGPAQFRDRKSVV